MNFEQNFIHSNLPPQTQLRKPPNAMEGTDVEELWSASFYGRLPLPQWHRNHVPLAGAKQMLTRHEGGKHATTFSRS
jgi:hypothetical protein